jgi:ABC-type nitrate/sulfonate/bicarbonate transport system substrate-binding protein
LHADSQPALRRAKHQPRANQIFDLRKGVDLKVLEGKRMDRPPGSYVAILFTLAAQENGVDLSKVNLVNVTPAGTAELQSLKSGDLDGLFIWSPIIDRTVVEGYGYYPACCDIGSTKNYGAGNQFIGANADFLKDREMAVKVLKAYSNSLNFYVKIPIRPSTPSRSTPA